MSKPLLEYAWTTLFYGPRGACKSLHSARTIVETLFWLDKFYGKNPMLPRAILMSNQKLSEEYEELWLGKDLFYWEDLDQLHYCPRENCFMGKEPHRLHGAYIVFDDISTILPPDSWSTTPLWLRKMFSQARHNGVRILANCQDPMAVDINFRRYVDVAYKFQPVWKTRDPDPTKKPIKSIFGIYHTRFIEASMLWLIGDKPEQQIRVQIIAEEKLHDKLDEQGEAHNIVYDDTWSGKYHLFFRKHTQIYDTHQNVKEYIAKGYKHTEYKCLDPHCKYKHVKHELI